jgi:hypothetical protein
MLRLATYRDMGDERPSGRLTGRDRPQTDGGDDRSIKNSVHHRESAPKTLNGDVSSGTGLKGVPADRETAPKGEFCALEDWNSALSATPSSPPFTPTINATHMAQMSDQRRIWRFFVERRFQANFCLASEPRRPRPHQVTRSTTSVISSCWGAPPANACAAARIRLIPSRAGSP